MRRASAVRGSGRRAAVDLLDTESPAKRFLRRNLTGAAGLGIISIAAALAAALATWSVNDPSLNHATGGPVRNALGAPGAIVADVLMQTIGLATAVFLVPLVLWGWRLLTGHALGIGRKRLFYWVLGSGLSAGALAALPVPQSWPLPTGLGGFLGDMIHGVPAILTSNLTSGAATIIGGLGLGVPAGLLLLASAGWLGRAGEPLEHIEPRRAPAGHGKSIEDDLGLDDEEEGESRLSLMATAFAGQVSHIGLLAVTQARRMTGLKRAPVHEDDEDWDGIDEHDDYEPEEPAQKSRLQSFRRALTGRLMPEDDDGLDEFYERGHMTEPDAHDLDDPFGEDGEGFGPDDFLIDKGPVSGEPLPGETPRPVGIAAPEPAPAPSGRAAAQPAPTGRVIPPAPKPKQSKRAIEEAQPSFLGAPEEYELPPLALLQEPDREQAAPISAEALDDNARMLESVLDDYGVRGEIGQVRPGPVVTLYELDPAPGLKASRVIGLSDDIARSMCAVACRVSTVPGRNVIGVELPNAIREKVLLREMLSSTVYGDASYRLALALGKDIAGEPVVANLARMPHSAVRRYDRFR
jgi:S-DNA-T family DNA segregation ATPase FtsK/SpoIIIE